ncbi:MAG: AI-2E family transporter [Pseudomonadales bacterium]|nr:AI-2E family transporter [Pseudomonadales bacterium]
MSIIDILRDWTNRVFGHIEGLVLLGLITICLVVLLTVGFYLAPVIAGLVVAFALHGVVKQLILWRIPRLVAIGGVLVLFIGAIIALFIVILPLVWAQLQNLVTQIPQLVSALQAILTEFAINYPQLVPDAFLESLNVTAQAQFTNLGGQIVQQIVQQLPNLVWFLIFLLLVPISLFFFLKDHKQMVEYLRRVLPKNRPLLDEVGRETIAQMGSYIRGKLLEILIVGGVCYIVFSLFGLQFAALLSLLVGLSVIIPFVGAAVVTVPVVIVALVQFGWTWDFFFVVIAYAIIQVLDGNVLVPLLFTKANDLHPVVIIVAVLAFGGLWGIWGVFFAIPLATFIRAVINAWPTKISVDGDDPDSPPQPQSVSAE